MERMIMVITDESSTQVKSEVKRDKIPKMISNANNFTTSTKESSKQVKREVKAGKLSKIPTNPIAIKASVIKGEAKFKLKKEKKLPKIRSCDFCRNSKIRCDRLPDKCSNCAKRGKQCTRNNPYFKRGPKPKNSNVDENGSNGNFIPMEIKSEAKYSIDEHNGSNYNFKPMQIKSELKENIKNESNGNNNHNYEIKFKSYHVKKESIDNIRRWNPLG